MSPAPFDRKHKKLNKTEFCRFELPFLCLYQWLDTSKITGVATFHREGNLRHNLRLSSVCRSNRLEPRGGNNMP